VTIYELAQAIGRHKRFLLTGLSLLVLFVLILTFSYEDGGIVWRGGLKYESEFQVSVVAPGTKSLSEPRTADNLRSAAVAYADLLASEEAAVNIGELTGFLLSEPVETRTNGESPVIRATIIGPSPDLAKSAANNAFNWLAAKIQQPIDAQPPVETTQTTPEVVLSGPFNSSITIVLTDTLSSVDDDVFVLVDVGPAQPIAVPVAARAGSSIATAATLEASGSLLMNLELSDGTFQDTLRLAPDPLPQSLPVYPSLEVRFDSGSIRIGQDEDEQPVWLFRPSAITTTWIPGTLDPIAPVTTQQFQIAMLTDNPTAIQIGGRRGPLVGFAVLIVGLILLLSGVIVAEAWRRDRDTREVSPLRISSEASVAPDRSPGPATLSDVEPPGAGVGESDVMERTQIKQ